MKTFPPLNEPVTVKGTLMVSPAQKADLDKLPVEISGVTTGAAKVFKLTNVKTKKPNNDSTGFISL